MVNTLITEEEKLKKNSIIRTIRLIATPADRNKWQTTRFDPDARTYCGALGGVHRTAFKKPRKRRVPINIRGHWVFVDRGVRALIASLNTIPGVETYSSSVGGSGTFPSEASAYVEFGGNLDLVGQLAAEISALSIQTEGVQGLPEIRLEATPRGVFLRWRPMDYRHVLRIVKEIAAESQLWTEALRHHVRS